MMLEEIERSMLCFFDKGGIVDDREWEVGDTRLSDTEEFTTATCFEIKLCEHVSTVLLFEVTESRVGFSRFVFGLQKTIRLEIRSSDSSTQLM